MFDIGFNELLIVGLVALIVIGPERLPRVARTVGHLAGRLQRYVSDVKADINREIELDELRKMRDSVQKAAGELQSAVTSELHKAETDMNSAVAAMQQTVSEATGQRVPESPAEAAEAAAEPAAAHKAAAEPAAAHKAAAAPAPAQTAAAQAPAAPAAAGGKESQG